MNKPQSRTKPQQTPNIKDNIHDIFEYKKAYEIHVKKLSEIRNMRRNSLKAHSIRNSEIEQIRDVRHNNFVYRMNQEANKICGDNLRLFDKLNREMTAARDREKGITIKMPQSMKAKRTMDLTASYNKLQRQKMLSKQNKRLKQRIKSSQSYINSSKLLQQQRKRQELKSRIRKFNANSQLKYSKSQQRSHRYFSAMSSRQNKDTSFSCNLSNPNQRRNSVSEANTGAKSTGKDKNRKISSFYNPREVIMNKIENFGIKYSNYRSVQGNGQRPATTAQAKRASRNQQLNQGRRHNSFFATQNH